jgi:Fe2+ transport system protein B
MQRENKVKQYKIGIDKIDNDNYKNNNNIYNNNNNELNNEKSFRNVLLNKFIEYLYTLCIYCLIIKKKYHNNKKINFCVIYKYIIALFIYLFFYYYYLFINLVI